jgi:hypothetical protein
MEIGLMHEWGDDWPFWDELEEAEKWIKLQLKLNFGYTLTSKEKYGSIRYEHVCDKNEEETHRGWKALTSVVFRAVNNWPDLQDELLEDLAVDEDLVGKEIHDKYWTN